jgi:hypothetical protein
MTSATAGRSRRTVQIITVLLVAVIVALPAFMIISGFLTGTLTLGKVLPVLSLLTIVLVTGVVGLVVAGHQPRNPIGWLLAGEAVFILLSVAGGAYANLVYRLGYQDLAFAGPRRCGSAKPATADFGRRLSSFQRPSGSLGAAAGSLPGVGGPAGPAADGRTAPP